MAMAASRKQRLRTLENQIRKNWEGFVLTGVALKEIRDDELFAEAECDSWGQYLSQRVTKVFGIASSQAKELIVCAEIRPKLPEISAAPAAEVGWTAKAVYQFRRLAPQDENHSQRFDYSRF